MEAKLQLSSQGGLGVPGLGPRDPGKRKGSQSHEQIPVTPHLQSPVGGVRPQRAAKQPPCTMPGVAAQSC